MTKWPNDDRMRGISEFCFFCPLTKSPSFLLIPSFGCHSRMPRNENEERRDFIHETFHSFSLHSDQFHHSRMSQNDGMRVKWGRFLKQGETLNSEISLILPSFDHSLSISFSSCDHSIHLRIIPNSNLNKPAFLSFLYHSCIILHKNDREMTERWWNGRDNHLWPKKEGGPALASFRSERKREVYPPIPLCRGG